MKLKRTSSHFLISFMLEDDVDFPGHFHTKCFSNEKALLKFVESVKDNICRVDITHHSSFVLEDE